MSGKNLTFKLILDGDSKGLVAAAKQSESTVKAVFDAIKSESDKLKQATESTSKEIGNIVPKGTSELADKLSGGTCKRTWCNHWRTSQNGREWRVGCRACL